MNNRVIYIFDEEINSNKFLHYCKKTDEIFACPVTTDEDCISSTFKKISFFDEVTVIPFIHLFNEKAFSLRDDYIKFIYDFGEIKVSREKNLKEYFKSLFGNFSTWWFSLIAEKSPLKTKSFHNLVKLLTILDLRKKYNCKKILIDLENPELTQVLIKNIGEGNCKDLKKRGKRIELFRILFLLAKTAKSVIGQYRNILRVRIAMRGLNLRKKILQNSKYLVVTYFPAMNKDIIKDKKFVNKYYKPLQNALEEKYKGQFSWLVIVAESEEFNYEENIFLGREINKWGNPLFFYEEWLNLFDFFLVTLAFLYISFRFFIKLPFIKNQFRFQDKKIWGIFKEDWYLSFSGYTLAEGLFYYQAFKKVFKRLPKGTSIIYLVENQPWEKALNIAARRREGLKTIGIQHTITPLLLLDYFNYEKELENGNYIQKTPKPDFLGCVGKIPFELFKKSGWDEKKLFILGAIRHQYLKDYLKKEISWEEKENKVVVALSIMPEESKEILLYIYQAFNNSSGYKVIIKGHPDLKTEELINSLNLNFDDKVFKVAKTSLSKLLPKAKCLIVTGSSSALEGITFGCAIIVPRLSGVVDMNPLSGISNLPIYVESSKELRKVVNEVMEKKKAFYLYERCKRLLTEYFDFPDADEEFLERFQSFVSKYGVINERIRN